MVTILAVGYLVVGLGSGTTFLCAMGAAFTILPNRPGIAVGLPGICMSLSMALTIALENGKNSVLNSSNYHLTLLTTQQPISNTNAQMISCVGVAVLLLLFFLLLLVPQLVSY